MNTGIYALASGYGKSAIAVIRITRDGVLSDILNFIDKKDIKPRYATLVKIFKDKEKIKLIDNCILIFYKGKNSYCGIDTVELFLHGSLFTIKEVFKLLDSIGYREAQPGEFTKLAVLNGKIDLIQAEAINNLINSDNPVAFENSLKNLEKEFSYKLNSYERTILDISSFLEATLEYPEEDLDEENNALRKIEEQINTLISDIEKILDNSNYSLAFHNKINIVIVGPTNSGKSSLFNSLLKDDRAIVSDIHGTTRDYIESELILGNLHISLFDTAGIRESDDIIEKMGIQRVKKLIDQADYLIFLISIDSKIDKDLLEIYKNNKEKLILIINKIDLIFEKKRFVFDSLKSNDYEKSKILNKIISLKNIDDEIKKLIEDYKINIIPVSIEYGYGVDTVENYIRNKFEIINNFGDGKIDNNYFFIQTIRQKNVLEEILNYLIDGKKNLFDKGLYDLAAENFKNAYRKINELTGKKYSEELFNLIFSKFCLGK